ncbi:MAG: NUMOD4 motif-containing HNH endonuclease [Bacteroidota bacterium]
MIEWKEIEGYKNYSISNDGRVMNTKKGKLLCLNKDSRGYYDVTLCNQGKYKHSSVHRLVAMAFISNLHNKREVNHIDANKLNNNITNLEWVTRQENAQHAVNLGLGNRKLTESDISDIKKLLNYGILKQKEISELYNVNYTLISKIKHGAVRKVPFIKTSTIWVDLTN